MTRKKNLVELSQTCELFNDMGSMNSTATDHCFYNNPLTTSPTYPPTIYTSAVPQLTIYSTTTASITLQAKTEPPDAAEVLRLACLLGKRLLMRRVIQYGIDSDDNLFEIRVVEFSPSFTRVKIQHLSGAYLWRTSENYLKHENTIVEVLDDDHAVSKVQDEQSASDKTDQG
jgi:hypothetical protein